MSKEIVLSGIRSTGNLHLGNYYGAVRNFLRMQKDYECFFFIADFHSLTTHPTPKDQHENVKSVLSEYLAAGLDPELCTLYIQSDIPEIPELSLLLNMISYVGELERTTTFKEKVRKQPDNVNAGLLTYPVLMAADILIHRSHKVPVGKDQQPHLEFTRKLAQRFNNMYQTEFFPLPEPFNFGKDLVKVPGLDGSGKMGKSEGNGVYLIDSADEVRKKVMRAVTDSGPTQANQDMPEPIRNLFYLMEIVSDAQTLSFYKEKYAQCEIRYGDMKKQLAEDIIKITSPIRERILEIMKDNDYLKKVARIGAEKARASASKTLAEVRKIIGFKSF
jgi:tryptophanyl-tRNA synthetase